MSMPLGDLEQPGVMQLLVVVNKAGGRTLEKNLTPAAMKVTREELNRAVEKLLKLGLLRRIQSRVLPQTGDLELTETGRSVASRLAEIQLILAGMQAADTTKRDVEFRDKANKFRDETSTKLRQRTEDVAQKLKKPREKENP